MKFIGALSILMFMGLLVIFFMLSINFFQPVEKPKEIGEDQRAKQALVANAPSSIQLVSTFPPYATVIQQIDTKRQQLAVRYRQTHASSRQLILNEARQVLIASIRDDLLPQWLGTPWDFNGTSETPRQGTIACGYLVTTVLRDAGLQVPRIRLAQMASEAMIKHLTTELYIKRFSNVPIETFVAAVRAWGEGLYIVGLDYHTGFIVHDTVGIFFVHTAYTVAKEPALDSPMLIHSKYRVLGKISDDDRLIYKWLVAQNL